MKLLILSLIAGFAFSSSAVFAQPMKDETEKICNFNDKSFSNRQFAKIKAEGPKAKPQVVLSEPKECPKKGKCKWLKKEVVPPNMKVMAGKKFESYTCVQRRFLANNSKIFGWVPTKNLNLLK